MKSKRCLTAALAAALALRRTWKRRKLRKLLEAEEPSQAVSNMTTWAVRLLGYLDVQHEAGSLMGLLPAVKAALGTEAAAQYEAMVALQRRALFSQTGVTSAERETPKDFLLQLEAALKRSGTWTDRFRLRWFLCVI